MAGCPQCGDESIGFCPFNFGRCPETGHDDSGERWECWKCGATGNIEEIMNGKCWHCDSELHDTGSCPGRQVGGEVERAHARFEKQAAGRTDTERLDWVLKNLLNNPKEDVLNAMLGALLLGKTDREAIDIAMDGGVAAGLARAVGERG